MNMSYCRFQNTAIDLQDCASAIESGEAVDKKLSREEKQAKKRLVEICQDIIDMMEYEDQREAENLDDEDDFELDE